MHEKLEIVTCHFNPIRYQQPQANYHQFAQHMKDSGVRLITVECALGERDFEVTEKGNPDHVQVRSSTVLWLKENLLNMGFQRLSEDCKYVGWFDSDITFRRCGWAEAAAQTLQRFKIIQPWSDVYDLGPEGVHMNHFRSFARQWYLRQPYCGTQSHDTYEYWHPGFAWCARRETLERLGGLIDRAALGAADHHMALSLIGRAKDSVHGKMPQHYMDYILNWQKHALDHVNYRIGYLPGTIEHSFHGKKTNRKYWDRWEILIRAQFDPYRDLKRNLNGVLELTGSKPDLQHDIDWYFSSRDEDCNTLQ